MWQFIVRVILRNRISILVIIGLLTAIMAYLGSGVKMSYEMARMLPKSDSINVEYEKFKEEFGQDGSVIFVAVQDPELYSLEHYRDWYELSNSVNEIYGVEEVISTARMYRLIRNDDKKKFNFSPIISQLPQTQSEVDSLKHIIYGLPLYVGRLFNPETNVTLMMITLDKQVINSKKRIPLIKGIKDEIDAYGEKYNIDIKYSGLPYIRTVT